MPISMVTHVVGNSIFDSESKQDPSIAEKKELISSTMKKGKVSQEAANLSRTKMVVSPIIPNDPWEYYEHPKNEEKHVSEDLNNEAKIKKKVEVKEAEAKNKAEEEVGRHRIEEFQAKKKTKE